MIGPKKRATLAVPRDCTRNSAIRMPGEIGRTIWPRRADARRVLQALDRRQHRDGRRDDAVAVEQRRADHAEPEDTSAGSAATRCASAISASVPPSPLLSARIRKTTYLIVTMRISAQVISETTPRTASSASPPRRRVVQGLAHGVERAGADVAEHHAQAAQHQHPLGGAAGGVAVRGVRSLRQSRGDAGGGVGHQGVRPLGAIATHVPWKRGRAKKVSPAKGPPL